MKILIIDNYDSFTYNLFQQVSGIKKCVPDVFKNDEITYAEIVNKDYDCIIISPGPGHPANREDFGVCHDVLAYSNKPVLGVCLGHQGIGLYAGGKVVHAPEPFHGRLTPIFHSDTGLFKGLPQGFDVVRYHSLIIEKPLPKGLKESAWTADGIVMGIEHETKPFWGIQYHPESISTEFGNEVIGRFLDLALEYNNKPAEPNESTPAETLPVKESHSKSFHVEHQVIDFKTTTEIIFYNLFKDDKFSFWLDTSKVMANQSRFSIMGNIENDRDKAILFDAHTGELSIIKDGETTIYKRDFLEYLDEELDKNFVALTNEFPFNFNGGFVGYLGYELKEALGYKTSHKADVPDAALILTTQFLVIDHQENKVYIIAITKTEKEKDEARQWVNRINDQLQNLLPIPPAKATGIDGKLNFHGSQDHAKYISNIKECLTEIKNGESYEICLTNRLSIELELNPLDLYLNLRKINPAQYSSYLHFDSFSILSSSPEQFLKQDHNRNVSTKPIKGTIAKHIDPEVDARNKVMLQENEKFRAENLMIVDLLRNDFGRVCEIGSVTVPHLMAVEVYETLNHLVSTVVGKLKPQYNIVDLVRATFPGGSITGAPKIRTMEIIDRLENDARGPYTGGLGYISFCGAAELNIIIRTAVVTKNKVEVGTGGAIISLSDPEEEFDEILLKAFPLVKAIVKTAKGSFDESFYTLNLDNGEIKQKIKPILINKKKYA